MVKNIFPFIIVGLFGFIAGLTLLHKGLPPTHDGEYHVVRFYEFYQTLHDGNWYPRWAPDLNNGYGIPLFNYVYPLPNYAASFLHFLGASFIDSFKLNLFFACILGAIMFYLWSKEFWGRLGGIVSSVFYTFSPYHFLDIYIRGSVGEVWALAFFPAFLWSITRFIKHQRKFFFLNSSIFLSLIIFSHNILGLMFLAFSLTYIAFLLYQKKEKKLVATCYVLFAVLLGIGLSAIFWLPAVLERQYVTGLEIFDVSTHFPDLYQLLIPSWGSGFSGEAVADQMSFQIGIANLTAVFLSLLLVIIFKRKDKNRPLVLLFIFLFFVTFFLMFKVSLPIWHSVPFMNYFQFPWRFLSLEILITSFLAGSILYFWKSKFFAICLIFLTFSLGIGYAKPAYYHYRDDNYYLTRSNFIDGTNSPGNAFNTVFLKSIPKKLKEKAVFLKGNGRIEEKTAKSTMYDFSVKAESNSEVLINTAYFPGWKVFVNESEVKINNRDGLISFFLPKGSYIVNVLFKNTFVRNIATFISIGSFFILIFLFRLRLSGTIKK